MPELSDEAREWVIAENKRRNRVWLMGTLAFVLPIAAYAAGFPEAGPYLFAWFIVMALAFIVDGQIETLRRGR